MSHRTIYDVKIGFSFSSLMYYFANRNEG